MADDEPYAGRVDDGEHLLPVRVCYEDTDASGIVYHANYLRYFERGRTDLVRLAGVSHTDLKGREEPLAFVVRRLAIEYLRSAKLDDALIVRSSLAVSKAPRWRCASRWSGPAKCWRAARWSWCSSAPTAAPPGLPPTWPNGCGRRSNLRHDLTAGARQP